MDILLANAGIEDVGQALTDCPIEVFDKVIAVNVRGVWLGSQIGEARNGKTRRGQYRQYLGRGRG